MISHQLYYILSEVLKCDRNKLCGDIGLQKSTNASVENSSSRKKDLSGKLNVSIVRIHVGEKMINMSSAKIRPPPQINRNLEAMARQLYDYWFVQFDFPDENGRPYKSSGGKMVWNEKLKRKIPVSWSILQIEDILDKYPSTKRFDTSEYLNKGKYPIIDQGESYIVGFTNDEENILFKTPAVVFGDHSTRVKFVATPFGRGADGTQILYSRYPCISIWYLFCAVSALEIPNPGYSRHFKYLKELPITVPDSCTAQKFADILRPIFDKWNSVIFENIELQTQRDELLPLLMNGQVSVMPPEVNCDLFLKKFLPGKSVYVNMQKYRFLSMVSFFVSNPEKFIR